MTDNERDLIAANAARAAFPVFQANGWTYGDSAPPTVNELEATVKRLLVSAGECGNIASGRFHVAVDDEGASVSLELADLWFQVGYVYLYAGLTRAEAEAAHRAMAGCPVKTPALLSAAEQMAELCQRWAKHDGDKRHA